MALNSYVLRPAQRRARAGAVTNSGHPADAETVCQQLLAIDTLNSGGHYVMALCREHDQKAAFLDSEFAMPRLHLCLLARRFGDLPGARAQASRPCSG